MAVQRKWSSLKLSTRRRYAKAGITRAQYESGASLKAARGHAKTPEHGIKQAMEKPEKFPEYLAKKGRKAPASSPKSQADRDRRDLKRIGERYGIESWILDAIRPDERRRFIDSWNDAHNDYVREMRKVGWRKERYPGSKIGQAHLDEWEQAKPGFPKEVGFYH